MPPFNRLPDHGQTISRHTGHYICERVCTACDRYRLKKSKCDGSSPCSRCKTDNAIYVFGQVNLHITMIEQRTGRPQRKNAITQHDLPKGCVEMPEQQQQISLVYGLKEMCRRLQQASAWDDPPLNEIDEQPLTHDILAVFGLLTPKSYCSGKAKTLKDSPEDLRSMMVPEVVGLARG